MSAEIATPEVIIARGRPANAPSRENSTFQSKHYHVHVTRCVECRAEIRYARIEGEKPDPKRRCCDCMSFWWAQRRTRGPQ